MTFFKGTFYLVVFLAFFFASCEYEPVSENFKEVDPTGIQSIEISLDQIKDTLIVGTWTQVGFDLEFPKPVNFTMKVKLGTTTIHSAASQTGTFTISPFEFPNGFYPLIFEVVASSGTLSLADRLEVEQVLFEYQGKIVQVETSPAQKTNILSIIPQRDGLHITWPKYPKANFTQYILHKIIAPVERGYPEVDEFVFDDIRQTSFTDPDFLGGNAEYRLQVVTFTDMAFSDPYTLNVDPPVINYQKTTGINTLEVRWDKSSFPTAFGSYHLLEDVQSGLHDYYTTSNINDTIATIVEVPFGIPVNAELRTQPKAFEPDYANSGTYSTFKEVHLGDRIQDNATVLEIRSNDRLYYYRNGHLYAMMHSETKPYDSLEIALNISEYTHNSPVAQSPDGLRLYVSSGNDIVRVDAQTLDVLSSITLTDILAEAYVFPFAINVNNNNRIIVDVKKQAVKGIPLPIFFTEYIAILDANTLTVTDTIQLTSDIISLRSSADQKFVAANTLNENKVFELSAAGVELRRATLSTNMITNAVFTATELHMIDNSNATVYALSDFSQVSSTPHPDFIYRPMIDPLNGNIGGQTAEDEYSVFNPITMAVVQKVKVGRYSDSPEDFIQLMNNRLVSRAGFRLQLP
jgi:hypothetical protein